MTCQDPNGNAVWEFTKFPKPGYSYRVMGMMLLKGVNEGVSQLYHSNVIFGLPRLLCLFVFYWVFSVITYGICVPSGLFVPALAIGAAYGRLIGEALYMNSPWLPG
jgi:H+/Cl- antiporter ClcA